MIFRLKILLLLLAPCVAGCAIVGPASIRGGRMAYNEAIVATNSQQVLAMIVRMRYGESTGLLAVTSVTANMHITANVGGEAGFGSSSGYEGNLVPLSVGVAYEENPTISYAPIEGEQYLRELLSPMPLDLTVLLLNSLRDSPQATTLLLRSINGIQNPAFLGDDTVQVDPSFTRIVELLTELGREDQIVWTPDADGYLLVILNDNGGITTQVRQLFDLLGLSPPPQDKEVITLPVHLGLGKPEKPAIHLHTRSLYDLFNIAAASVDVPQTDLKSGIAHPLNPLGPAGDCIHIQRAKNPPDTAVTAVKFKGWWYYIDGTDTSSKLTFRMLESLTSVRIADTALNRKAAPVLTVPVSR